MEVHLRCEIPDVRGMLSTLAGAISGAGANIQAVQVVEAADGRVTDDLWIITEDLATVAERIQSLDQVKLVHQGLSRGGPGDISTRLATGLDMLLSGAMEPDEGLATIVGGSVLADTASVEPAAEWPTQKDRRILRLPVSSGTLVLTRDYRFLDAESLRAHQLLAVCERAIAAAVHAGGPHVA